MTIPSFRLSYRVITSISRSGELQVSATIDNLLLEVNTPTLVIDEESNPIVLESGTGTTGKFIVGETITGGTSKATAEVLVDDLGNATTPRLFITSQQQFVTGETITGGTSSATGTVTRYRASLCTEYSATSRVC